MRTGSIVTVRFGYGPDSVQATITGWNNENGTGLLSDGEEIDVFESSDGDGYLVMSDQDTARLLDK